MPKTKPFDRHHAAYEKWFKENHYAYESELRAVKHFIPEKGRGIEIGSGSGRFAIPLGITEGIEPSYSMRKLAKQNGMEALFGLAEHLPLENESYDFVLMVTTICFVDHPQMAVNEMYRILKPGGSAVIGLVDKESPMGWVYRENKHKSRFYYEASFFSVPEIDNFMKKAGFASLEFVQTLFGQLEDVNAIQSFKVGYGDGSFVVVRGKKSFNKG